MRSFRARRQGSQWGLEDDDGWPTNVAGAASVDELEMSLGRSSSSGYQGGVLRRGQSLARITLPCSEDRELSGGRLLNEEAMYNMRKKWISDRLIERFVRLVCLCLTGSMATIFRVLSIAMSLRYLW